MTNTVVAPPLAAAVTDTVVASPPPVPAVPVLAAIASTIRAPSPLAAAVPVLAATASTVHAPSPLAAAVPVLAATASTVHAPPLTRGVKNEGMSWLVGFVPDKAAGAPLPTPNHASTYYDASPSCWHAALAELVEELEEDDELLGRHYADPASADSSNALASSSAALGVQASAVNACAAASSVASLEYSPWANYRPGVVTVAEREHGPQQIGRSGPQL